MEYPSVDNIIVMSPKKDSSTYFSQIYFQKKRKELQLQLDNVICFYKNGYIYIKNKSFMMYMTDLNSYITNVVKEHCENWFNNNIDKELVDEYYDSPIKFTKEHGNVVKIHTTDNNIEQFDIGKYNVHITIKGLRFLKQKFYIESSIVLFELDDSILKNAVNDYFHEDSDSYESSDEDIPEPIPDDIENIREKYRVLIDTLIEHHTEEMSKYQQKLDKIIELRNNSETTLNKLLELHNKIENIVCVSDIEYMAESIQNLQT